MNIGFIGCGNMAKAIIKSILKNGSDIYEKIFAYDVLREPLLEFCSATGVIAAEDSKSLIDSCDMVVLAVKPQVFAEILPSLAKSLQEKKPLVVSIAAAKTIEFIASLLKYDARIGRVFPNLNAEVSQSVSAYCVNEHAENTDEETLRRFCESFGTAHMLSEEMFSVFGALSGCAPAYTFLYIAALAKAAFENGLDEKTALDIASNVALGSAMTLLETGEKPEKLIERVCSPGGTTIEGIEFLRENAFEDIIRKAFNASLDRDRSL